MPSRRRGREPVARKLILCVLVSSVLFVLWGCEVEGPRTSNIDRPATVPGEKTEAELLAAVNEKFENPQGHYDLARVYHKAQNWTKADYHYNVALGFDPAYRAVQAGIVKMWIDRGQTSKAEQLANTYIGQATVTVRDTLRLGWEFGQLGLDDYALRSYQQAVDAAPDSYEANRQIGFYYLSKGDQTKAKQYLMRSFDLYPRQPDVAGALGRLGVVVQLPEGAVETPAPGPK